MRGQSRVSWLVLSFWLIGLHSTWALELGLPFSDSAVLQAGKKLPIWGKAASGSEVGVRLGNRERNATANHEGVWRVVFDPVTASFDPVELEVRSGSEVLKRRNLLFGEVWLASGQSNMQWSLKNCAEGPAVLSEKPDQSLRVLNFQGRLHPGGKRFSREFLENLTVENYYGSKGWQAADPESLSGFSGVGYFFARKLREELKVPVGIIHLAVGGSPIEAHMPREAFVNDKKLNVLLHEWWRNEEYPKWCRERAALNLTEWFKDPIEGRSPPHPFAPSFLWEAGVQPILPLPVKGVIWYQGESNATVDGGRGKAVPKEINRRKFEALIGAWRKAWRNEALPVCFVQLPGLNRDWELFREMQYEVAQEVPHTAMAVTIDVGHPTNVHPRRKRPVGERLADLALAEIYGQKGIEISPEVREVVFETSEARVLFDREVKARDGKYLIGFEVAGKDQEFVPAEAVVDGETVRLSSKQVATIEWVRYGWADDPVCNLVGRSGLPVGPFRRGAEKN